MSWDELVVFAAVARARSFSTAARQVNRSQSAVSQRVGSLERRLGVRLLHRSTRRVEPTAAGRIVADATERMAQVWRDAERQLAVAAQEASGRQMDVTVWDMRPMPMRRHLSSSHPEVGWKVRSTMDIEDAMREVRVGGADALVAYRLPWSPWPDTVGLVEVVAIREPLCIVVPMTSHLAGRSEVDLSELEGHRWAVRADAYHILGGTFPDAAGFEPAVHLVSADVVAIMDAVADDDCVTLCSPCLRLIAGVARVTLAEPLVGEIVVYLPGGARIDEDLVTGVREWYRDVARHCNPAWWHQLNDEPGWMPEMPREARGG